ncbi:hypothetical protein FACS189494_10520 [Spirochaetia bacterium]|nr:hypothetical protein FACS189494_10520 [Spirochaetia bacterium]
MEYFPQFVQKIEDDFVQIFSKSTALKQRGKAMGLKEWNAP